MKRFILGALAALAVVALLYFVFKKKENKEILEADTALIQTQIENVSKLVVTEGHFAEVISYTESQKYFMDLFTVDKKILTVVNADVTVAYDLKKLQYEIDEAQKKVVIKYIPQAEIKIFPTLKYYDVSQSQINPFKAEDVEKIRKKVNLQLRKKVEASNLKSNAENRLLSELSNILVLTKSMGWTLEYNSLPLNDSQDLKLIEKP
ncbi:Protein of unknown function [Capnocytophaga haemolytica]|jgi:hypothetical protein|uniref:DUF4230 domain-containing protein n=1 Tax=Capnocytophaga haemolytica TaxID=45243 RepID=A0AAX2H2J8_9FLAO|nr:DUF4230 domain-containing protein [Capnocytophaga haemolytica]AMD85683.1 hypothetical protein AXF12_09255 [Capnocytophaga haemolytica]SFN90613.1 Protein of unknown function [Capnocytophaga haemolytica]SNV16420.1 Uncharacterised protein [Capnocytophaga haemolytica]